MLPLQEKYSILIESASETGAPADLLKACFSLLSLSRAIDSDCATRLDRFGLTEGRFVVLFLLMHYLDGLTPTQLSQMAGVTKATITGLTDGLVQDGFVERSRPPTDRRSLKIRLTTVGKKITRTVLKEHSIWISSLFSNLSNSDIGRLHKLLHGVWKQTDEGRKSQKTVPHGRDANATTAAAQNIRSL